MKQSEFLSLGWRDFFRGLAMAVLTPIVIIVQQSLEAGTLVFNWKSILTAGVAGGVAYLVKNLFTPKDTGNKLLDEPIIGDRPKDRG